MFQLFAGRAVMFLRGLLIEGVCAGKGLPGERARIINRHGKLWADRSS